MKKMIYIYRVNLGNVKQLNPNDEEWKSDTIKC